MNNTNNVAINYDSVLSICDNMLATIKKINDEFEKVNEIIFATDEIWEGDASTRCFWSMKKKYAGYVTYARTKLPSYIKTAKIIIESNKQADTQISASSISNINALLPSITAIQAQIYEKISYRINEQLAGKTNPIEDKIKSSSKNTTTTKTDSSSKSTTTTKTNNTVKNNTTTTSKTNSSAKNNTTTTKTNSSAKSTSTTKNINVNKSHSDKVTTNDFTYEQTMKNSKFNTNDLKTNQTNTSSMEIKSLEEMINELNNK